MDASNASVDNHAVTRVNGDHGNGSGNGGGINGGATDGRMVLYVERELQRQLEEVKGELRMSHVREKELKLRLEQQRDEHNEALARESTNVYSSSSSIPPMVW